MSFTRKRIRLSPQDYIGKRLYFVTVCCDRRQPVFANEQLGQWLASELCRAAQKANLALHSYCIMPDHLHLLVEGLREDCDLVRFVSSFKQETGSVYSKRFGMRLWQTKYYDRILRRAEQTEALAWYIWLNPVRKGLCGSPQEYPLSGSLTIDWKKRCCPTDTWNPPWRTARKMPG